MYTCTQRQGVIFGREHTRVMRCGFADERTHRYFSGGTNQSTASAIRFLCAIIGTLRCSLMTNQCLLWVFSRQSKCNWSRQDPFSLHWSSFWILPYDAEGMALLIPVHWVAILLWTQYFKLGVLCPMYPVLTQQCHLQDTPSRKH